jgi:hypothetical protein
MAGPDSRLSDRKVLIGLGSNSPMYEGNSAQIRAVIDGGMMAAATPVKVIYFR